MEDNRRQHERIPVRTVVRMQFETIGEFYQSYAQNISEGGMRLAVAQELADGDPIAIEFRLRSDEPLIEGTATVRWCQPSGDHYLIGVAFHELDDHSRAIIQEAVSQSEMPTTPNAGAELDVSDLMAPPEEDEGSATGSGFSTPDVEEITTQDLMAPQSGANADFGDLDLELDNVGEDSDVGTVEPDIESLELPDIDATDTEATAMEADFGDLGDEVEEVDMAPVEEVDMEQPPPADPEVSALFEDTAVEPTESEELATDSNEQLDFGTDFGAGDDEMYADTDFTVGEPPAAKAQTGKKKIYLLGGVLLIILAGVGYWVMNSSSSSLSNQPQAQLPNIESEPKPTAMPSAAVPATATTTSTEATPTQAESGGMDDAEAPAAAAMPQESEAANNEPAQPVRPKPEPKTQAPSNAETAAAVTTLLAIRGGQGDIWLEISGDGTFAGHYKYFALSQPPRAVIDVLGSDIENRADTSGAAGNAAVRNVRIGKHTDKLRIVLDLAADRGFEVTASGQKLVVRAK